MPSEKGGLYLQDQIWYFHASHGMIMVMNNLQWNLIACWQTNTPQTEASLCELTLKVHSSNARLDGLIQQSL